ncbi:acyl-CoA dehydrogenase family protein [Thermomonas sp.]|uniref:acyl-CoA dehydrogenase family protein n=1 Tax=Thermomonas sp. TaxID=1971895 RepID=UPI001ACD9F1A|nr:acyl-CoA dehydrogenase family protein [Xanthomonadales bacterium]MBN8767938.1 acyl-CoA dehydrogenase family protein [Stenotrophomonas sp.]
MAETTFQTHEVFNQPPPPGPFDLWKDDAALRAAVAREGGAAFSASLAAYGALAGDALLRLADEAHRDRPRLQAFDAYGRRIDRVAFNAAYHEVMGAAIAHGVAGLSWAQPQPGAHVARAALSYLHYQAEPGSSCPLTMTHAAVPVLRQAPALREWADKACAFCYDGRDVPMADKRGVTLGMGMTEKQGGSDVRANTTRATPLGAEGEYALVGHKWFFSAPMSDAFLVLAQAPGGLSCFLLPRWRPDGTRNALRLMRLKDKLGDWSNASSEVEFDGAWAHRIGDEGRGVATILEMVMLTRLDCMLGSAGLMRMALRQALHHAGHRRVFGKRLLEQPLMRRVLADLVLESEAATALSLRVAGAVDRAPHDPGEAALARIATAIGKYWICKRTPGFVNEAQECLGGIGYIEETLLPRLVRQAPLNSIWEGSGNIQCLDVLRALAREPETGAALRAQWQAAAGMDAQFDAALQAGMAMLEAGSDEAGARAFVERLALLLQGAILLRAQHPLARDWCSARLGPMRGAGYGSLPAAVDADAALARVAGAD